MRGDRFGLLKAAELAAEMIADYERGHEGAHHIRVELNDEGVWDDVHVSRPQGVQKWQIKRLLKIFDRDDAAKLIQNAASAPPSSATFHIGVPHFVPIQHGARAICELKDLAQLCQEARKPGVSASAFASQVRKTLAYRFVSSCVSQPTDAAVLQTLQRVYVQELGLEEEIRERAAAHLRDRFDNAEEVVRQLENWFVQYPDGTITVDINLLYTNIVNVYATRHSTSLRWIHLARDAIQPQWASCGPLRIDELVKRAWGIEENVRLQLGAEPFKRESVSNALSRLVLHQSSRVTLEATHAAEWRAHCLSLCGGTLGLDETPAIQCDPIGRAPTPHGTGQLATSALANKLAHEMNEDVWDKYVVAVGKHLYEDQIGEDLRTRMHDAWVLLSNALSSSHSKRESFMRAMLATAEEYDRGDVDTNVRNGCRLVENLARATVSALAIVATLQSRGVTISVDSPKPPANLQLGDIPAHLIALSAASHPKQRTPYLLYDDPDALLSSERGITILGVVTAPAEELYRVARQQTVPFHASDSALENYRHAGPPFPLLTASPTFRAAMRSGLAAMERHLRDALKQMNDQRTDSLRQAVEHEQ